MDMRLERYRWSGGEEAMLRFGPEQGPTLVAALPLFEEANRTRAAVVDVLRRLAARGIGGALPDLPGTGESLVATKDATLAGWRSAFVSAAQALPGPVHVMAWRGGALIAAEAEAASRWYLAPISGSETLRELRRVQAASAGDLFAGNRLSGEMLAELDGAEPMTAAPLRVVRLASDPRPADLKIDARPLWRGAEPGTDQPLQTAIADDIAAWIAACAA